MDVFVSTESGLLKRVSFATSTSYNCGDIDGAQRSQRIVRMCWMDEELLCALADGFITSYDVPSGRCRRLFAVPNGQDGLVKGIATMDNQKIITCVEAGEVSVWDTSGAQCQTVNANVDVNRMRQSPHRQTVVATGGKENDLKVWDLESGGKPIFTARNVRCDYLSLRVPVWVRDIAFLDENSISTCTAYGQIRAYDIRSGRRRPVIDFSWDDCTSFTVMAAHGNNQVVAGCTRAKLGLFDIRGKKHLVHAFRGHTGGVTAVVCHAMHPYVVSSSVDRFVRLYGIQTKTMLHKALSRQAHRFASHNFESIGLLQVSPNGRHIPARRNFGHCREGGATFS
ncbi:WD repeat containing protein 74 [Trichuris trichiura]|uniref:WD repeat containing protein 74 n=1 Tax=Trichuris trichiura TaxID=36087 RepID=A0A077YXH5_TRITR|nr:WD repeat containing protein 74 [Trichuris trichiura]